MSDKPEDSNSISFFDKINLKGVPDEVLTAVKATKASKEFRIAIWDKVVGISGIKTTSQEQAAANFYKIQGIMSLLD